MIARQERCVPIGRGLGIAILLVLVCVAEAGCSASRAVAPLAVHRVYVAPEVRWKKPTNLDGGTGAAIGGFVGVAVSTGINATYADHLVSNLKQGSKSLGDVARDELIAQLRRDGRFELADDAPVDATASLSIPYLSFEPYVPKGSLFTVTGHTPAVVVRLVLYDEGGRELWRGEGRTLRSTEGLPVHPQSAYYDNPQIAFDAFSAAVRIAVADLVAQIPPAAGKQSRNN